MGYASALLSRDVGREQEKLEKEAGRKGAWGSIGRTLGGLAATVATGGAAAPWAVGLASGAGTLAGGAIGSAAAGRISEGQFFKGSRKKLRGELKPFGAENITGALTSGLTAGMAQKAEIGKRVSEAKSTASLAEGATKESIAAAGKKAGQTRGFDFWGSKIGESKPMRGLLSKHRQSAWEAAGGTTSGQDFSQWMNEKTSPVVQRRLSGIGDIGQSTPGDAYTPQVSMADEAPNLLGLPSLDTGTGGGGPASRRPYFTSGRSFGRGGGYK